MLPQFTFSTSSIWEYPFPPNSVSTLDVLCRLLTRKFIGLGLMTLQSTSMSLRLREPKEKKAPHFNSWIGYSTQMPELRLKNLATAKWARLWKEPRVQLIQTATYLVLSRCCLLSWSSRFRLSTSTFNSMFCKANRC